MPGGFEPMPLPPRFAQIKQRIIVGREIELDESWRRLLGQLKEELEVISAAGPDIIPSIDFADLTNQDRSTRFLSLLRERNAAIVRNVVPKHQAAEWLEETRDYLSSNPAVSAFPARDPDLLGLYWTPAQIRARAHPNILAVQKHLMRSLWHSNEPSAPVSTANPVAYADRIRVRPSGGEDRVGSAFVDGGSVERWEPDGYGLAGTYQKIWEGRWEEYDPWESSTRLRVTSDLYNGAGSCSMFRMFQGWLPLQNLVPGDRGSLLVCPMVRLSTAYFLLRPFFSPLVPASDCTSPLEFLREDNWIMDPFQSSVIQGALPSYAQEINDVLHPHLRLGAGGMVHVPALQPGDYVVWHSDMIYAIDVSSTAAQPEEPTPSPSFSLPGVRLGSSRACDAAVVYLPACPLTQTNALYLARQRKAFLLGQPSPDFGGGRGESRHMGRPGVQEISEAGGDEGLRAMGLLPWEAEDGATEAERDVVAMANAILFPDRYDWSI